MGRKIHLIIIIFALISCQNNQKDGKNSFVNDFQIELLLNINPFESENFSFDYKRNSNTTETHIYVGKLKHSALISNKEFNNEQYYIQLNNKIAELNDLKSFVFCSHCETGEQLIFINADKNTPKEFLSEIESEILKYNINEKQIYYLTINTNEMTNGYNHSY